MAAYHERVSYVNTVYHNFGWEKFLTHVNAKSPGFSVDVNSVMLERRALQDLDQSINDLIRRGVGVRGYDSLMTQLVVALTTSDGGPLLSAGPIRSTGSNTKETMLS